MTKSDPNIVNLGDRPKTEEPVKMVDPYQAVYDPSASYSAEETALIRSRQSSRSRVTGILLIGMCILFFAITVVKIGFW